MAYYISKVFWLLAAPTNALVLISAIAAFWPYYADRMAWHGSQRQWLADWSLGHSHRLV